MKNHYLWWNKKLTIKWKFNMLKRECTGLMDTRNMFYKKIVLMKKYKTNLTNHRYFFLFAKTNQTLIEFVNFASYSFLKLVRLKSRNKNNKMKTSLAIVIINCASRHMLLFVYWRGGSDLHRFKISVLNIYWARGDQSGVIIPKFNVINNCLQFRTYNQPMFYIKKTI